MREILFRGKRVDNGEWAYGYYAESHRSMNSKIKPHKAWIVESFASNGGWLTPMIRRAIYDETVGQYTGLTDKNGTKIFENDILVGHLDDLFPDDETELIVEWHDYGWFGKEEKSDYISLDKNWVSEFFEVAGNIFDNC